jgi:hypothetical protein
MGEKMTSPRSGATKTKEAAIDLSIIAMGIALAFEIARYMGHAIPEGLETKAALFLMALAGTIARTVRHWALYLRGRE